MIKAMISLYGTIACIVGPVWELVEIKHGHTVGVDGHHVDDDTDNVHEEADPHHLSCCHP